jgi:Thrombospondin type 3 repeat
MLRAPLAALIIVLGALVLAGSARADPRFDPSFDVALTQSAPQVPSELTLNFRIGSGYQLSTAVIYIPFDWGVVPSEQIPVGTKVAVTDSVDIFGLINSPCNQALAIHFDLFNATLDPSQTVSIKDREWEQPVDTSAPGFGTQDFAEDKDGNGLVDAIDRYPDFLDPALGDVRPIARMAGVAINAGVPRLLQFLIFAPGSRLNLPDRLASQAIADAAQSGYPMLMVMQDFRNPDSAHQPDPITDYCTPLDMSLTFVPPDRGGGLLVNPQSGAYGFTLVGLSKRDADGDGFENSLDNCPFVPNVGDSRALNSGDVDGDGMDVACDPNDEVQEGGSNVDEDGDGYLNRQDICPLVQVADIFAIPPGEETDVDFDDIGDACDPNPQSPDGEALVSIKTAEVVVGEASGSGGPPKAAACPHCYRLGDATREEAGGEGGQLAVAIGLIGVGAGAAAIVAGSGAVYLIRRRRG